MFCSGGRYTIDRGLGCFRLLSMWLLLFCWRRQAGVATDASLGFTGGLFYTRFVVVSSSAVVPQLSLYVPIRCYGCPGTTFSCGNGSFTLTSEGQAHSEVFGNTTVWLLRVSGQASLARRPSRVSAPGSISRGTIPMRENLRRKALDSGKHTHHGQHGANARDTISAAWYSQLLRRCRVCG